MFGVVELLPDPCNHTLRFGELPGLVITNAVPLYVIDPSDTVSRAVAGVEAALGSQPAPETLAAIVLPVSMQL